MQSCVVKQDGGQLSSWHGSSEERVRAFKATVRASVLCVWLQAAAINLCSLLCRAFEGRGKFVINDGYSRFDKAEFADDYMQQDAHQALVSRDIGPCLFSTALFCCHSQCCACRAMFLLMNGTFMRGDDTRRLQLRDLFWHPVSASNEATLIKARPTG